MARHQQFIYCVNFNSSDEVKDLLTYLKNNRARVIAFAQQKTGHNTFAVLTKYREKEIKK